MSPKSLITVAFPRNPRQEEEHGSVKDLSTKIGGREPHGVDGRAPARHSRPMSTRYALYAVPAAGHPLGAAAAEWLGRDAEADTEETPHLPPWLDPQRWREITAEAGRYGFHGTLKPPMALAPGETPEGLEAMLGQFATTEPVLPPVRLEVATIAGFIALLPRPPSPGLSTLADRCVERFDRFRAPASDFGAGAPARGRPQPCPGDLPRALGLSLRLRPVPLSHDAHITAVRRGTRPDRRLAARSAGAGAGRSGAARARPVRGSAGRIVPAAAPFRAVGAMSPALRA